MRATHTYAILEVSPSTYAEIRRLLEEAGYKHSIHTKDDSEVIDMRDIALQSASQDRGPMIARVEAVLAEHFSDDALEGNVAALTDALITAVRE